MLESEKKIEELFSDISYLRKAIQKNSKLINQLAISHYVRLTVVLCALTVILFSVIHYFIESRYGSFAGASNTIRYTFFGAIALSVVALQLIKQRDIIRGAKEIDSSASFDKIITEIYTNRVIALPILFTVLILFFTTAAYLQGHGYLWVPIVSVGIGVLLIVYYVLLNVPDFLVSGIWQVVSGCAVCLLPQVGPRVGAVMTISTGFLILAGYSLLFAQPSSTPTSEE